MRISDWSSDVCSSDLMCRSLADGLVEQPSGYRGSVTSTKLKVSGIDVFSAGDFSGGDGCEDIVLRDASRGVYKRVIVRDDRIVGAVLYGDTADGSWYFDQIGRASCRERVCQYV